jgi:hypothetical protein
MTTKTATPNHEVESLEDRTTDLMHALADGEIDASNISADRIGAGLMAVEFRLDDVLQRGNAKSLARQFGFDEAKYEPNRERTWSRPGRVGYVPTSANVRLVGRDGGW